jgi:fructose-1,6-bisphosphatase/inositol monophosphatase family enzyme
LEQDGELCLGVLYLPALGEMLWAERGSGAFLNDKPVRVSVEARVARGFVIVGNEAEFFARGWAASFGDLHGRLYHNPGFLDLYSYATLASGRVDAVVMVGEAPWDVAAARVIVEEAGGRFTDFRGESTVYGGTTIASNGHLHDELLELLGTCR